MATLSIVVAQTYNPRVGYKDPVPSSTPLAKDVLTTSGTSQQSAIVADPGAFGAFWVLTVTGGNVWVKFGEDPTAAAESDWLILDGQTREFSIDALLQKIAVIDA